MASGKGIIIPKKEIQEEAFIYDMWTCVNHLSIVNMKLIINGQKGEVERTLRLESLVALCIVLRLALLLPLPLQWLR